LLVKVKKLQEPLIIVAAGLIGVAGGCSGRTAVSSVTPAAAPSPATKTFRLTSSGGVGFDDLLFSPELHALLAPAGGTGCVRVFESSSLAQTSLCGIGPGGKYDGGHGEGTTSADAGAGWVFAIERSAPSLQVIEPKSKRVLATAPLAAGPDYVRWVASKREIWVTEPDREQIEVFTLKDGAPQLAPAGTIAVRGGPESLVIDAARDRAFSHLWQGRTVQISLSTRAVSPSFANGCQGSRGIALDGERGQLFVGCAEGKATVLDVNRGGALLASQDVPEGVDIVALDLALHHLYLPASSDGSVSVLGVGSRGQLSKLGLFQAAPGAHCAASDDHHRVWVCAPDAGSLLVFDDTFPPVVP
jgi:hypothetical protein